MIFSYNNKALLSVIGLNSFQLCAQSRKVCNIYFDFKVCTPIFYGHICQTEYYTIFWARYKLFWVRGKRWSIKINECQRKCFLQHSRAWPHENIWKLIQGSKHFFLKTTWCWMANIKWCVNCGLLYWYSETLYCVDFAILLLACR